MVETIHSAKLADKLNKTWSELDTYFGDPLNVMVQVNASNEPREYIT